MREFKVDWLTDLKRCGESDRAAFPFAFPFDAVIVYNVVAMRAEPRGDSEQISQAICNDFCLWLDDHEEYVRVRTGDDYEGWVFRRHVTRLDPKMRALIPSLLLSGGAVRVCEPFVDAYAWSDNTERVDTLVYGTRLLKATESSDRTLAAAAFFGGGGVLVPAGALQKEQEMDGFSGQAACRLARRFLGTPYLWGGTTPFGFDCSGLVQRVYAALKVPLPRDAYQQAVSPLGTRLDVDASTQAGDLVFFCGPSDPHNRGITHVGIALDTHCFVHAVSKEGVIITPFADPYYAARYTYRGAWRYRG